MAKKQVAGYILEKRIGKGSYATVWKGRDDKQELVAIKVISRQTVTETAQLRQEVEVLRKISHPNIVRFRDLKKSTAHFYLVLEYCAGGDLSQFLRAKGRVQEETARRFLTQIASGLFVLHSSNHLHRDLKPQNILLSDCSVDPVLKLADFGFARALPEQDMAATVCGSPLYMAPEILRHEPYDAKADLWSVGAILYELLLGRTPFSGSNPLQLLANIETTALSFEGVQLSAPGQQFLRALLVHSPSQRLSSQAFMQHPYVSLSPPSVSLTQGAVSETSKDQPSPVADVQDTEGSFIVTEWIDKVPKSGAASPSAFCSPEESPRDAAEEAPGTGFITASSSAGSGYRGETGDTVKKVEELTASEVGVSKDVPASTGKVSPFLSEVINATARDTRKQAVGGSQAEVPEKKRNGNMDEDQYVVLASNTPTAFARGKGPTPAVAASSFCSNLTRIARTLEQLAMRLVEQAPVEALSLLLRALSLLEKALKVSLDDEQMGEPLRRDFTRTFAAAEKVERQLQSATLSCAEFCAVAQPNRAIFESAVQHAKDAAVVLSKGQEAGGWEATCHEKLTLSLLLLELLNSEADGEDVPAIAAYTAPIARLADEIERRLKASSASRPKERDSFSR
mmetsp:Transcript_19043/g.41987  ORF Transcript_19043/g.41987 Transcript_19043/m.41987 type:complete len:625 (-) Transcript_19043:60-1934(-)